MSKTKKACPPASSFNNIRVSAADQRQGKYTKFAQIKEMIQAFDSESPKSMLEVSYETGIMRSNITWFIRELKAKNAIKRVRTGICPITKMRVGLYSTCSKFLKEGSVHE